MNIYFDIETIPLQDPALIAEFRAEHEAKLPELLASVKAPGNYKDEAKIAEFCANERAKIKDGHGAAFDDWLLKTGLDGGLGQVCVIGWAVEDEPAEYLRVNDLSQQEERDLISAWFDTLRPLYRATDMPHFVGHNVIGFDLPFIWKRCMVLGIKPPSFLPRNPKPWADTVSDTMLLWDSQQRAGGSMDRICKLMGIPGKGDMDGSKVWPMVQAGDIAKVAAYCCGDVERTRAMHLRMTFATPPTNSCTATGSRSPGTAATQQLTNTCA